MLTHFNQQSSSPQAMTLEPGQSVSHPDLANWNNTAADYPQICVHQQFEAQAAATPNAIAVEFLDRQLTYQTLNQQANQLAHYLRRLGVGPETLVALCLERSEWVPIAMLGILKAGGAYIPLDPSYPPDRLALMLEDSQTAFVVTQQALAQKLASIPAAEMGATAPTRQTIELDRQWLEISQDSVQNPDCQTTPASLMYVIYTSGSTGKPKGVMIAHRGFVNLLAAVGKTLALTAQDRFLSTTSISFDIVGLELYLPWVIGARTVIASRDAALDGQQLGQLMIRSGVTVMQATPASWRLLLESGWQGGPQLKVLCGGEAMAYDLVQPLLDRCSQLWNLYGPTETTVWSTAYRVLTAGAPSVPVGRPLANTQLYVLDQQQQPVPIGAVGELYIGGDGVARGYLNRAELTGQRFLPNPWMPNGRLYRTGDLARYQPDGNLEFLGRIDHQVKIRGFRIELGEIEAILAQHPHVGAAVVIAREDRPGDQRLVAYVLPQGELQLAELRQFVASQLPAYMVPNAILPLDQFPLTPNGKVDRAALPAPTAVSAAPVAETVDGRSWADVSAHFPTVAAQDNLESQLVKLWESVLGVAPIGITDNFFELGGHSLLVARLLAATKALCHRDLTPTHLYQAPTIQAFAQLLRGRDGAPETAVAPAIMGGIAVTEVSSAVVIQPGNPQLYAPLFCIHVLGKGLSFFRPLSCHLNPEQPVYGLSTHMAGASALSVEAIAADYIQALQQIQPQGPYYLTGVSFGGDVAYEMARQLQQAGHTIALLALLDTYGPNLNPALLQGERLMHHLKALRHDGKSYLIDKIRDRMADRQRTLMALSSRFLKKIGYRPAYELQFVEILEQNIQASKAYVPQPYAGRVTLFRATEKIFYPQPYLESELGWLALATGGVERHDVPGDHMTMLQEPQVQVLAARFQECLAQAHALHSSYNLCKYY
jgi:amino acid adenylation domain-containing protein